MEGIRATGMEGAGVEEEGRKYFVLGRLEQQGRTKISYTGLKSLTNQPKKGPFSVVGTLRISICLGLNSQQGPPLSISL